MLAEFALRTAVTGVCKEKGFTFVDFTCFSSQGSSAGHSRGGGR